MTAPAKPKVVHVYRSNGPNPLWIDQHTSEPYAHPSMRLCLGEYLGEYVPRASGPVPTTVIYDEARISALESELDTLRANQLSPAIVAAVRAYQAAMLDEYRDPSYENGQTMLATKHAFVDAIEADAKEREG